MKSELNPIGAILAGLLCCYQETNPVVAYPFQVDEFAAMKACR